jgi:hypothetical protein
MAKLDLVTNFARVTVLAGHTNSDTSIALQSGNGALLPVVPFNVVWWNSTDYTDPSLDPNVEIVRVTAGGGGGGGDTLTVTRGQEGTAATAKNTSGKTYQMVRAFTAKEQNTDLYNAFDGGGFFGRMPNPTTPKAYINSTAATSNDVYTVPAGRSALVISLTVANFGANNPNYYAQFKTGGTYYQITATVAVGATPTNTAVVNFGNLLLLSGEILSLHADAIGMSAWFSVIEFDTATSNLVRGLITSLANGANTLYTVSAGKTSRLLPRVGAGTASNILSGNVNVFNDTAGAITYTYYAVPSGGSAGVANEFASASIGAGAANFALPFNGNLGAGDFIEVSTSGAGGTAWVVAIEN